MTCEMTYEELAALTAGDVAGPRRQVLEQHAPTCATCRQRLARLREVDAALGNLRPDRPSAGTILATRRLLAEETRPQSEPEVLTLEEVAAFLRIPVEELRPFVMELPAFELGGQVRVRRARLLEWLEQREREFTRSSTASTLARIQARSPRKGVTL